MKKLLVLGASLAASLSASAGITWRSTAASPSTDLGGANLVAGSDNFVGYFVQLILDGGDGLANPVSSSSATGVSGDDTVADTAWFGAGAFTPAQGILLSQTENGVANGRYFVRAWNGTSRSAISGSTDNTSSLADGNESKGIPNFDASGNNTGSTRPLRYGDSALFAALSPTWNPAQDNVTFEFVIQTSTLAVVPEPTTAALLSMGAAGIAMALKRRRQIS